LGDSEVLTLFLVIVACGYVAAERVKADVSAPQPIDRTPVQALL